ncbi:MAG: competence/damage-inducible protein A [Coxiellaceae bacterium]|nr:competence/damage-inducible protein A [Coxiellaceae bacterium]
MKEGINNERHSETKQKIGVQRSIKRIAILGTGDEIINGDILNTNAQRIAQLLIEHDMQPGNHMVAADCDHDLLTSMEYLLASHDALITIGGLGPTSDDITRFALGKAVHQALKFDDDSWQMIQDRLNKFKLDIPVSNKQQCLFPQEAAILPNHYGTANGCKCKTQDGTVVYMLPGPPNECIPMFEQHVLPDLIKQKFPAVIHRQSWLLLGVSEGMVAETLDEIVQDTAVDIGYRVDYPYLEVKCHSNDNRALQQVYNNIMQVVGDQVISEKRQKASEQLAHWIEQHDIQLHIEDPITGGRLELLLHTPDNNNKISFYADTNDATGIHITLSGFDSYWQKNDKIDLDSINVTINCDGTVIDHTIKVPYRGKRMPGMACESICWYVLNELTRMLDHDPESLHTA